MPNWTFFNLPVISTAAVNGWSTDLKSEVNVLAKWRKSLLQTSLGPVALWIGIILICLTERFIHKEPEQNFKDFRTKSLNRLGTWPLSFWLLRTRGGWKIASFRISIQRQEWQDSHLIIRGSLWGAAIRSAKTRSTIVLFIEYSKQVNFLVKNTRQACV